MNLPASARSANTTSPNDTPSSQSEHLSHPPHPPHTRNSPQLSYQGCIRKQERPDREGIVQGRIGVDHWVSLNFLELCARPCLRNFNPSRFSRPSSSSELLGSSFLITWSLDSWCISIRVVASFAGGEFSPTPNALSRSSSKIATRPSSTPNHSPLPRSILILAISSLILQEVSWRTCRSPSLTRSNWATILSSSQLQKALVRRCFLCYNSTIQVQARLLLVILLIRCSCCPYNPYRPRTIAFSPPQLLRAADNAFAKLSSAAVGFLPFRNRKCSQWARITWSTISCRTYSDSCKYSTRCVSVRSMQRRRLPRAAVSSPLASCQRSSSRKALASRYSTGVWMTVCFTFSSFPPTPSSKLLFSSHRTSSSSVRTDNYKLHPYRSTQSQMVARKSDCECALSVSARRISPFSSLKESGAKCSWGRTREASARTVSASLQTCAGSMVGVRWTERSAEKSEDRELLFFILYIHTQVTEGD